MTCQRFGRKSSILWSILFGISVGFVLGLFISSIKPGSFMPSSIGIAFIQNLQGNLKIGDIIGNEENISNLDKAIENVKNQTVQIATDLRNEFRLLCWIMHEPKRVDNFRAIMETWGRRCHLTLFMVGAKDMLQIDSNSFSSSILNNRRRKISENVYIVYLDMARDHLDDLWIKTRLAFIYIYQNFRNDYDWVLKVDDDSFVIVENLRLFLRDKNPEDPFYYGCQYKTQAPRGFNSGGPGYVISRVNVDKFVPLLDGDDERCGMKMAGEDVRLAECLDSIGIGPADTRDKKGRFRFSPFNPENTINHETLPEKYNWFWGFTTHNLDNGFECCSDTAISFHYITSSMMRTIEYLIYYVHPFNEREIWQYNTNDQSKSNDSD